MRPGRWAHCTILGPQAARYSRERYETTQVNNEPAAAELNYCLRENLLDWQVFWVAKSSGLETKLVNFDPFLSARDI